MDFNEKVLGLHVVGTVCQRVTDFALAPEYVDSESEEDMVDGWKKFCKLDTLNTRALCRTYMPNSEYQVDTQSFSLSHLVLLIQ